MTADATWFRDARFGMFVHWGLYSVPAGIWKGVPVEGNWYAEWIQKTANHPRGIPREEYRALAEQFNPRQFDADAWIREAKNAGMRYFLITAKHHDGFALWPSKVSAYNIVDATPFKRDVLAELRDACQTHGLRLGFYYSHWQDWDWSGGAQPGGNDEAPKFAQPKSDDFEAYWTEKCLPQVRELMEHYNPAFFWFDNWRKDDALTEGRLDRLIDMIREIDPDCLINSRIGTTWNHPKGDAIVDYRSMGDNAFPEGLIEEPWETSGTLHRSWGYHCLDFAWKPSTQLLRHLIDNVSRNGNYQLNIGPMGDGTFPVPAVRRLREIGAWTFANAESIYGTRPAPLPEPAWGRLTLRTRPGGGQTVYAHVYQWPENGLAEIAEWKGEVKGCHVVETGQPVDFQTAGTSLRLVKPIELGSEPSAAIAIDV